MRSLAVETGVASREAAGPLTVLDGVMRDAPDLKERRVIATDDSRSIDEGLAVLGCYVAISDRRVRQAILDVLVAASGNASA